MKSVVLFFLKALALLPLWMLYGLSDFIYFVIYRILGYRRKVVRQNLEESFPEKSEKEICGIERKYYRFMSDIIVETIKLLHISERAMRKRVEVCGYEKINETVDAGKSVVLYMGHYGNWEWAQEIGNYFGDKAYKATIYRPLNSKLWNAVYGRIRSRWHVNLIPRDKAPKTLLSKENRPWICGFIADARPVSGHGDNRIVFLHHSMTVIYGPESIGDKVGADFYFLEMQRVKRGYYRITFHPLEPLADGLPHPVTRAFWLKFEEVIKREPAYWLWSHKRWKYDHVVD